METFTTDINRSTNRGSRIWIEGSRLTRAGFHSKQTPYTVTIDMDKLYPIITLTVDPTSKRRVSGKGSKPVIDMRSKKIEKLYPQGEVDSILVTYTPNQITFEADPNEYATYTNEFSST